MAAIHVVKINGVDLTHTDCWTFGNWFVSRDEMYYRLSEVTFSDGGRTITLRLVDYFHSLADCVQAAESLKTV